MFWANLPRITIKEEEEEGGGGGGGREEEKDEKKTMSVPSLIIIDTHWYIINIIIIINIMCQVCCRHRRSWPSNPLCHYFSWWASCWKILFLLRSYLDWICCALSFSAFWCHKSSHPIFPFNSLSPFICPKTVGMVFFFWWFWVGISRTRPFPLFPRLTSFLFMIFSSHVQHSPQSMNPPS